MKIENKTKHLGYKDTYSAQFLRKEIHNEASTGITANQVIQSLQDENESLKQDVSDLKYHLKTSLSRIPHLYKLLTATPNSKSKSPTSVSLNDLLLSDIEIKEAIIKACWLSRYWTLACRLGVCPAISAAQAVYWSQHAPTDQVLYDTADKIAEALGCSPGSESSHASSLFRKKSARHNASHFHGAIVADIVEIERALVRMESLGVVRNVRNQISRISFPIPAAVQILSADQLDDEDDDDENNISYNNQGSTSPQTLPSDQQQQPQQQQQLYSHHPHHHLPVHLSASQHVLPTISEVSENPNSGLGDGSNNNSTSNNNTTSNNVSEAKKNNVTGSSITYGDSLSNPLDSVSLISDLEADEIQFQKAWLAFFWGRAALLNVIPEVSKAHAEFLAASLWQPPKVTDFKILARMAEEMTLYGIDEQIWRQR